VQEAIPYSKVKATSSNFGDGYLPTSDGASSLSIGLPDYVDGTIPFCGRK